MKKVLKKTVEIAVIVLAVLFYCYFTDTVCVFRKITGIPCPGCGMTRAFYSLLDLDIIGAFEMHPLFIVAPLFVSAIFLYTFDTKSLKRHRFWEIFLLCVCVLFIAVWIIRLIYGWR